MTVLTDLLALQKTDIALSQAHRRLAHLPEISVHKMAVAGLEAIRQQRVVAEHQTGEAQTEITQIESESSQVDAKAARLKKQLRSVIAPREAEALQHEIASCDAARSSYDDKELTLMELVEALRVQIDAYTEGERVETERVSAALGALRISKDAIRQETTHLEEQRSAMCLIVPGRHLADYEEKRKHISGGAVAELHGPTCQSCHLDISRGELDAMKGLPADEFPECPNCGSYLVI